MLQENYFKKVMNDGLNTFTIDRLEAAINKPMDNNNKYTVKIINSISSGRGDNRNKKTRGYKRKIATILMLALKVVRSQRVLKYFKSFMDTIFISYGASKQLRMYLSVIKLQPKSNIPIAIPESNIASHRHLTNLSLLRLLNKYLCLPFNTTSTSSFPDAFCASNCSVKTDDGLVVTSLSPTIVKYAFDMHLIITIYNCKKLYHLLDSGFWNTNLYDTINIVY